MNKKSIMKVVWVIVMMTAINMTVSGVISWAAAQMMYVFIDFNRNHASSSYPGDLTAGQEWMYLAVSGMLLFAVQAAVAVIFSRLLKDRRLAKVPFAIAVIATAWFLYAVYGYLM